VGRPDRFRNVTVPDPHTVLYSCSADSGIIIDMKKDELVSFSIRLKDIRTKLGYSQKDFAESIGVSGGFLSEVESAKSSAGFTLLFNIARVHGVNLNYLVHGQGKPFSDQRLSDTLEKGDFGIFGDRVFGMLEQMKDSEILTLGILESYLKIMMENGEFVKREIELKNRDIDDSHGEGSDG